MSLSAGNTFFKTVLAGLLSLAAFGVATGSASAQVATNMYGQAQLLPPGVQNPTPGAQGPQGAVSFEQSSSGGSTITASLTGLQPGGNYYLTIEDGSCGGPVRYTLKPFAASTDGTASQVTDIPDIVHTESSYISLHDSSASAATVLCGNVHVIMTAGGGVAGGTNSGGTGNVPGMPTTGEPGPWSGLLAAAVAGALVVTATGLSVRMYAAVRENN